ncbi:tyrosine-type recombinase/integrase [Streptomyces sp. NPDC001404]|uniref:tyrosine-type recombinase/integrase n=1 Tax=Streptomyces sp. NPDC001404 TaxID=3364571 RepID=UPI003694A5E9
MTTSAITEAVAARPWQLSAEAVALWKKFPPRTNPKSWPATRQSRAAVVSRMLKPPSLGNDSKTRCNRKLTLLKVLDWLEMQPGTTWQERWDASGVGVDGRVDWRTRLISDLKSVDNLGPRGERIFSILGMGLVQLIGGDVLRPDLGWLMATASPLRIANEMERVRDGEAIASLRALRKASTVGDSTVLPAIEKIALIMAAKGGTVADVTPGDCLELLKTSREVFPGPAKASRHSPFSYQLLHSLGVFPAGAPSSVRMFSTRFPGQLTAEQLVDRYNLSCRPVRDLLVDYLMERQPSVDYNTLTGLATALALWFWKDLEKHHAGIDSLRLPPDIAASWKRRLQTRIVRTTNEHGDVVETTVERATASDTLMTVRAFYLDLAQWALDEPSRWGPWAAPCPIRADDVQHRKMKSRQKTRMDQRTRERLPVLPVLIDAVDRNRKAAAARLEAAGHTHPGEVFTADGTTLRRAVLKRHSPHLWGEELDTGRRRNLAREESNAFWGWAAVEVLRMTGVRIEELSEISHHSLVQYRLPSTGELVPLLQIAPSKTDEERLLVVSPELADVLSAIICRIRTADGSVPLVIAYDHHEKVWNPPLPLLFQRKIGLEDRPIPIDGIRTLLQDALAATGFTDTTGRPLHFAPHDFRRIFTTDAVMNGMPPHIAQLVLGHRDINTTMGYKAVYPEEAITGHRAFIARRRELRPNEEYRSPTEEEWEDFLGHFERRKVALGDCGRAYGTSCIHEHSCIRCPLLRADPAQQPRLVGIRDNLLARIAEAEHEGWAGEAEGLKVSLAAANTKLTQLDNLIASRTAAVNLGMPAFPDVAGRQITTSHAPTHRANVNRP